MTIENIPHRVGQFADKKEYFGLHHRFVIYPVHTRFACVIWFVADAECLDEVTGLPSIIRQEFTKKDAMAFDYPVA